MTPVIIETVVASDNNDEIPLKASWFEPETPLAEASVFFCLPGGGVNRDYFNLGQAEGFDYSFANRMTSLGHHVIAMDHPGTGENQLPQDHPFLRPKTAARYIASAIPNFISTLGLEGKRLIGVGHSMGGMVTILVQGIAKPYAALVLIGSSAGGLDWGLTDEEKKYIEKQDAFERDVEKLTLDKFKKEFPSVSSGPSNDSPMFAGESAAATTLLSKVTTPLYAAGGLTSMVRGSFRREVESIDTPMFFAFGDRDLGIPPEDAPKDFKNAPSTTLIVLNDTGHNSFAFVSIATLCSELDHWAHDLG